MSSYRFAESGRADHRGQVTADGRGPRLCGDPSGTTSAGGPLRDHARRAGPSPDPLRRREVGRYGRMRTPTRRVSW
jgi:hypothetical protein